MQKKLYISCCKYSCGLGTDEVKYVTNLVQAGNIAGRKYEHVQYKPAFSWKDARIDSFFWVDLSSQ